MVVSDTTILHTYRHLYRACLRAVRYEKPARYVLRNKLRNAFREGNRTSYDEQRLSRTLELLNTAARIRGFEYFLVKNITRVSGERNLLARRTVFAKPEVMSYRQKVYAEYDRMIKRLNDSMGFCIV